MRLSPRYVMVTFLAHGDGDGGRGGCGVRRRGWGSVEKTPRKWEDPKVRAVSKQLRVDLNKMAVSSGSLLNY